MTLKIVLFKLLKCYERPWKYFVSLIQFPNAKEQVWIQSIFQFVDVTSYVT